MTAPFALILTTVRAEHDHLVALHERVHYFNYYFCTFYSGCTDNHCAVLVNEQHLVELNSLTGFYILHVVYEELLALFYLELLTVNLYDCVHFLIYKTGFSVRRLSIKALIRAYTD